MPAPDASFIEGLKKHLSNVWEGAHAHWATVDSYYNRTFPLWDQGDDRPTYRPSTARRIIDSAVDTQMVYSPQIDKSPAGEGEEHERNADLCEHGLKAIFDQSSLLEPSLTWKQVAKHLILYGYTIVDGPTLNFTDKPQEPSHEPSESAKDFELRRALYVADRATWVPVRIRATHPARILLDPLEKQPKFAIKSVSRFSQDLHELTLRKQEGGTANIVNPWEISDDPWEQIETIEHFTLDWVTLVTKNGILYRERNTYGFIPATHAFSGFGQEPTNSKDIDPRYLAVGLMDHLLDSLKIQAQQRSGRHNALMEATFNTRVTSGDPQEIEEQRSRSDVRPGERGDLWWEDVPNLPNWLFQEGDLVDQDIELGSFSKSVGGHRQVGVSTVGQEAILHSNANKKFVPLLIQTNHLASVTGSSVLRLLDMLGESITLKGHTIGPKEIEHSYAVDLTFQVVDPVLQLQEKELGMREYAQGLITKESYWRDYSRRTDITGEARRLLKEQVRDLPQVRALMAAKVAQEIGLDDLIAELEAEGGLVGPDGQPISSNTLRQPLAPDVAKPAQVGGF